MSEHSKLLLPDNKTRLGGSWCKTLRKRPRRLSRWLYNVLETRVLLDRETRTVSPARERRLIASSRCKNARPGYAVRRVRGSRNSACRTVFTCAARLVASHRRYPDEPDTHRRFYYFFTRRTIRFKFKTSLNEISHKKSGVFSLIFFSIKIPILF